MTPERITAFAAIIVAIVSAVLTYRSSSQANRTADRKVDSEAYERAKVIWSSAIEQSEKDLGKLRQQIERLEAQVRESREIEATLRGQIRDMKATIARMERQNSMLRTMLRAAGLEVPDNGDDTEGEQSRSSRAS